MVLLGCLILAALIMPLSYFINSYCFSKFEEDDNSSQVLGLTNLFSVSSDTVSVNAGENLNFHITLRPRSQGLLGGLLNGTLIVNMSGEGVLNQISGDGICVQFTNQQALCQGLALNPNQEYNWVINATANPSCAIGSSLLMSATLSSLLGTEETSNLIYVSCSPLVDTTVDLGGPPIDISLNSLSQDNNTEPTPVVPNSESESNTNPGSNLPGSSANSFNSNSVDSQNNPVDNSGNKVGDLVRKKQDIFSILGDSDDPLECIQQTSTYVGLGILVPMLILLVVLVYPLLTDQPKSKAKTHSGQKIKYKKMPKDKK